MPYGARRNITAELAVGSSIVVDKKLVEIGTLHVLQAFICPEFGQCCFGLVVLYGSNGCVVAAVNIRKEIESPEELEEGIRLGRPVE
jgi:hypothetical protein